MVVDRSPIHKDLSGAWNKFLKEWCLKIRSAAPSNDEFSGKYKHTTFFLALVEIRVILFKESHASLFSAAFSNAVIRSGLKFAVPDSLVQAKLPVEERFPIDRTSVEEEKGYNL